VPFRGGRHRSGSACTHSEQEISSFEKVSRRAAMAMVDGANCRERISVVFKVR
jgi:hypothetical protein